MSDSKSCRDFVAPHISVLPKSGIRYFFDLVNTMSDVISLGIGEPDFVSPWSVCEGTVFSLERGLKILPGERGQRLERGRKAQCAGEFHQPAQMIIGETTFQGIQSEDAALAPVEEALFGRAFLHAAPEHLAHEHRNRILAEIRPHAIERIHR